jgi:hypothetical protein
MGQPSNRISKEKDKKREKGTHNSPKNSKEKCWNCGKVRAFKKRLQGREK